MVVVTGSPAGPLDESATHLRGRDYVAHLVDIARELAELPGESPRLFVVTRNAASVLDGDVANLEQGGLRGLMRVIDSEHPHLERHPDRRRRPRPSADQVALQLRSGAEDDETAWRNGEWYTARLRPGPLRPAERQTRRRRARPRRHAAADPQPR